MTDHHPVGVALENRLMSQGFYVTEWRLLPEGESDHGATDAEGEPGTPRDGMGIAIEYEAVAETPVVDSHEVGTVVRTFLTIADERDWSPGRLEVQSFSVDGEERGRWHVEREWFDGLGEEYTELEFSDRVLETIRAESGSE